MNINISVISTKKEASFSFSFNEKIGSPGLDEVVFMTPVRLDGEVIKDKEIYYIDAKGSVGVKMYCSRCLEPTELLIDFNLNEKFNINESYDEEIEAFSGESINLDLTVMDSILASLPMKVVCSDECKGLCLVCGQNLNETNCDCDTTVFDPRLEGLRSLLKFDEEV